MSFLQVYMRNRYLLLTNQITVLILLQLGSNSYYDETQRA